MGTRQVGLRQVKEHLSAYVAEVQAGESLVITVHGQPAARLVPIARPGQRRPTVDELLEEMAIEGLIDCADTERRLTFDIPPVPCARPTSEVVRDDRR